MKKKLKDALHRYKVEAFKAAHPVQEAGDASKEILDVTGQALENAYRLHFEKDADPQRIETFNLVKTFVLDALLPPVVDKLMRRILAAEKQNQLLVTLLDDLMETLSEDASSQPVG